MVGPEYDLISQQIMSEMLQGRNSGQKLTSGGAVISLGGVHHPGEKCYGALDPSMVCEMAPPIPTSDASASQMHGTFGCGNVKEVASTKAFLGHQMPAGPPRSTRTMPFSALSALTALGWWQIHAQIFRSTKPSQRKL